MKNALKPSGVGAPIDSAAVSGKQCAIISATRDFKNIILFVRIMSWEVCKDTIKIKLYISISVCY